MKSIFYNNAVTRSNPNDIRNPFNKSGKQCLQIFNHCDRLHYPGKPKCVFAEMTLQPPSCSISIVYYVCGDTLLVLLCCIPLYLYTPIRNKLHPIHCDSSSGGPRDWHLYQFVCGSVTGCDSSISSNMDNSPLRPVWDWRNIPPQSSIRKTAQYTIIILKMQKKIISGITILQFKNSMIMHYSFPITSLYRFVSSLNVSHASPVHSCSEIKWEPHLHPRILKQHPTVSHCQFRIGIYLRIFLI